MIGRGRARLSLPPSSRSGQLREVEEAENRGVIILRLRRVAERDFNGNVSLASPKGVLKGFQRIRFQPGETATVRLSRTSRDLAYRNAEKRHFDLKTTRSRFG